MPEMQTKEVGAIAKFPAKSILLPPLPPTAIRLTKTMD
jgi:hypothetical protein